MQIVYIRTIQPEPTGVYRTERRQQMDQMEGRQARCAPAEKRMNLGLESLHQRGYGGMDRAAASATSCRGIWRSTGEGRVSPRISTRTRRLPPQSAIFPGQEAEDQGFVTLTANRQMTSKNIEPTGRSACSTRKWSAG